MKKKMAALGLALTLSALASPAYPGPTLLPYCWNLDNTSCSPLGATKRCTDGIWSDYVCTCRAYTYGYPYPTSTVWRWDCPEVR
jgi:hypothetical protein